MSIATKLNSIVTSLQAIRTAIINKGQSVPSGTDLADWPAKISAIETVINGQTIVSGVAAEDIAKGDAIVQTIKETVPEDGNFWFLHQINTNMAASRISFTPDKLYGFFPISNTRFELRKLVNGAYTLIKAWTWSVGANYSGCFISDNRLLLSMNTTEAGTPTSGTGGSGVLTFDFTNGDVLGITAINAEIVRGTAFNVSIRWFSSNDNKMVYGKIGGTAYFAGLNPSTGKYSLVEIGLENPTPNHSNSPVFFVNQILTYTTYFSNSGGAFTPKVGFYNPITGEMTVQNIVMGSIPTNSTLNSISLSPSGLKMMVNVISSTPTIYILERSSLSSNTFTTSQTLKLSSLFSGFTIPEQINLVYSPFHVPTIVMALQIPQNTVTVTNYIFETNENEVPIANTTPPTFKHTQHSISFTGPKCAQIIEHIDGLFIMCSYIGSPSFNFYKYEHLTLFKKNTNIPLNRRVGNIGYAPQAIAKDATGNMISIARNTALYPEE